MQKEGKVKTPCPLQIMMYAAGNVPVSDYGAAD